MATFYARGVWNPASSKMPLAIHASTPVRAITDNFAFTTAMVVGDDIQFGKVPSHAILLPQSTIINPNLGASVTMNVGFTEGGAGRATALASALAMSTAGTKNFLNAVTTANMGRRAWELAGFTADPKRELTIVWAIAGANIGTAGGVFGNLLYVV